MLPEDTPYMPGAPVVASSLCIAVQPATLVIPSAGQSGTHTLICWTCPCRRPAMRDAASGYLTYKSVKKWTGPGSMGFRSLARGVRRKTNYGQRIPSGMRTELLMSIECRSSVRFGRGDCRSYKTASQYDSSHHEVTLPRSRMLNQKALAVIIGEDIPGV